MSDESPPQHIRDAWLEFRTNVLPSEILGSELEDRVRSAFYLGASSLFEKMVDELAEKPSIPRFLEDVQAEIEAFYNEAAQA